MKKLIIAAALLVVAATAFYDNTPVIRTFDFNTEVKYWVRKFEDGPNTCYTVVSPNYGAVALSCVVRSK